jgi:hypothetical protein
VNESYSKHVSCTYQGLIADTSQISVSLSLSTSRQNLLSQKVDVYLDLEITFPDGEVT